MFRAGRRARGPAGVLFLAAFVAWAVCAAPTARAAEAPSRLFGGGLTWSDSLDALWPRGGAWMYPVGDSLDAERDRADGTPKFRATRGVIRGHRRSRGHDGTDLSNRRSGDAVRAAAGGLVVHADTSSATDYGVHAVVGHRLGDGGHVVSVYAHLEPASLTVATGDSVRAGQQIGRVGRTGRASSPHLHFEVRRPRSLTESWLRSRPVDPLRFIAARLPAPEDPQWSAAYLAWAEAAGLIPRGRNGADTLTRALWQRMLQRSTARPPGTDPATWVAGEGGTDPSDESDAAASPLSWNELARDLTRIVNSGHRLAPCPVAVADHHERCEQELGTRRPLRSLHRLAARSGVPTLAETCLVLADLAVGSPRPRRKR